MSQTEETKTAQDMRQSASSKLLGGRFSWDKHFAARVKQAGGDPTEKIEVYDQYFREYHLLGRYSMSEDGCIYDEKTGECILEDFQTAQTKFD